MEETTSSIVGSWSSLPPALRPMLDPPEGVMPNFENPHNIGWHIVLATALTMPLAISFLILRFYTRIVILRSFKIDDYILLFTLCSSLVFQGCTLYSVSLGLGKNLWDIPWTLMSPILKWFLATELTYFVATCGCKVTILVFYLRFLKTRTQRYMNLGLSSIVLLYSVLTITILVFACRPMATLWDWNLDQSRCLNVDLLYVANASLNAVTDVAILVLPIPNFLNLKMPASQKIGLIASFTLGMLVTGIAVVRIVQLTSIPNGGQNVSVGLAGPSLWAIVEVNLSLICASIPAFRPFIAKYFGKHFRNWSTAVPYYRDDRNGSPIGLPLSNTNRIPVGSGGSSQNRKSMMFYKGSTVTTTEITASHLHLGSDERGLVEHSSDFISFIEQSSQVSLPEEKRKHFNREDLRIMKTSDILIDSKRISQGFVLY